jgi:hypothetical protein
VEKVIVSGIMLGAMGLFAEATADPSPWGNYTALGAVIAVLLFLVTRTIPDLNTKAAEASKSAQESLVRLSDVFAASSKEIQTKFAETLDRIHDRATEASKLTAEEMANLREHCAALSAERRKDG